jgi:autophagy-related protein 5
MSTYIIFGVQHPANCSPLQLYAHRISYLPLLLPRLHAFLTSSLIDPSVAASEGWFDCEDVPLKWHHPIGLLFDLYAGAKEAVAAGDGGDGNGSTQGGSGGLGVMREPWKLTVHFSGWPGETLIKLDKEGAALHDAFMNSVKEVGIC